MDPTATVFYRDPEKATGTLILENGVSGTANLAIYNSLEQTVHRESVNITEAAQRLPVDTDGSSDSWPVHSPHEPAWYDLSAQDGDKTVGIRILRIK
ncbi:hypothetical protein AB9P05_00325 [Roseivirga sp. BDSF3-8]|uniref:hypothetical protein n=1 Tax=Roseivirga sp. BDSF3-8 TaxID=3241598 RepID=UPI0035326CE1